MDEIDRAILGALQENSRISNAELARKVNLSPPAVHARVKRLEEECVIGGYVTLLNREFLGFDMLCFVHVSLQLHQAEQVNRVRATITAMPEVLECFHVTGEFDYLLKVVVRNRQELEAFVSKLTPTPGVARIMTSLVLNDVKATTQLPIHTEPSSGKTNN